MTIHTFNFNPYFESTYVLEESGSALIIDAGMSTDLEQQRFASFISKQHLTMVAVLITHGHMDHVCGLEWLQNEYRGIKTIYFPEEGTLSLPVPFMGKVEVLCTPGHKEDAVCYYLPGQGVLFSGDTLFKESVGRTDLAGGDYATLMKSLQRLKSLPKNTVVYPGHGNTTTIQHELDYNSYL